MLKVWLCFSFMKLELKEWEIKNSKVKKITKKTFAWVDKVNALLADFRKKFIIRQTSSRPPNKLSSRGMFITTGFEIRKKNLSSCLRCSILLDQMVSWKFKTKNLEQTLDFFHRDTG